MRFDPCYSVRIFISLAASFMGFQLHCLFPTKNGVRSFVVSAVSGQRRSFSCCFANTKFKFQAFTSCFTERSTHFSPDLGFGCVLLQCSFWVDVLVDDCLKILVFRLVEADWADCLACLYSLCHFGSRTVLK